MGVVAHGAPVFRIGGDPGGISTRAAVMMDRANEFRDIHSGLSSLKADGWEGRAADHFRSKFDVQIKGWVDAQEAFSSASEAYSSYASTLASAQSQCDGIRSRWKAGRDAVQQAQNNQADARNQAAADGGSPMFDASCDEGPGRSAMAAAEADFQTLVDQVNEAGDLLITALNAGIAKLPERTWWDSVKRTVSSVVVGAVEAVVDLAKLVWKLGGGEAWVDFGRMLMGDMTWDEYVIKHYEIPAETIVGMAKALWNDPVGFMTAVGKSLLDWDTWTDDPARAIGHLLPDVIMAVVTMGGSAGVSAGEKALTGGARALRIGKEVFKAILPISPDDIRSLAKLGKNMVGKLSARGLNTAADVADLANTAQHLAGAADHAHDLGHAANGMAGTLDGASDAGRAARAGGAIGDTSHAAHAAGGAADAAGSASHAAHAASGGGGIASGASSAGHAASGGGGIASSASHAANGAGSASHAAHAGGNAADAAGNASHAAHAGGNASHAAHAGGNAADAAGNASHAAHTGGNTADAAGNASHAAHGGADVKDSALPPTDPGHRSNGVSSAAQPAATPHASAAGDASTAGHAAPANTAPSASNGAHNNAFMNADTGGTTHDAGSTANGAPSGDDFAPQPDTAVGGKPPQRPDVSFEKMHFSKEFDNVHAGDPGASDLLRSPRDEAAFVGRTDPVHANGQTRGADDLVGAGVGRSEASVGAQGSYERAGAFGGSDPSRVSHGADGFGGTADFGANAGHAGHGAHGVSNSADVGGGVGDASRGTHAAGAPTGQGGGHVGADTGTHGGSSAPAQGPHRADPGMSTGDTHGASRADSTPGHGDTPRAGQGADGTPDAPTTPKKETPAGDALGGDKQPHSGKHAADTPATHADEAADTSKAGHGSGDASGSGKADADAKHGHDSAEHADADPKAKDHSANGKADDAADSARHGDKTEADKTESDKSHKEDDAAHHDGDEHPKDTNDKHSDKTDDADTKSPKDDADTHKSDKDSDAKSTKDSDAKSDKDSGEHADADPKAKDHSANGKADDAADSARHGDKTEADKPTSDKTHKEDDAAHHDGDEHPKDTDDKHSAKADDADTKSPKDDADTHKSDKDSDAKSDKDSDAKSDKDEADTHKSDKDGDGKSDEDGDGKTDEDGDGKTDKEEDADGSGTVQDETDSSAEAVEDQPQINPESLAVFPKDYPTLNHIDSAPLNMRPIDDIPELLEHPERMEPPTTIEELVERSPHRPEEPEWDNHELKDVGLGDKYKTAADITVNPRGQLSDGTHPEMKSTADWTRSRYYDPESGRSVWRTDTDFGAVPGTKRAYTDIEALRRDFRIDGLDRTSHVGGSFMAPIIDDVIIPNEYRGTPITSIHEPYRQYDFNVDVLPDGYKAEISIAAPEQGSLGGTPQIQVMERQLDGTWRPMSVAKMLDANIIKGVTEHVGEPQIPDFEAIKKLFDHKN